jgi:thiaminase/transcriptional activator TenA
MSVSFSERMRAHADRTWRAILRHRFFREVATDTIDDRVFARYLRIEYGFVDTAARALGYAVAKAPSFQERRRLGLGLYGLVTDQEQVFIDAFERMCAPDNERSGLAPQGLALPLHALFLKVVETKGYEEILACTLAAEWMYLTWCSTANQSQSSRAYILGSASCRRRICRACRLGPVGDRRSGTGAHRGTTSAAERAIRTGFGSGDRFSRGGLRGVIRIWRPDIGPSAAALANSQRSDHLPVGAARRCVAT